MDVRALISGPSLPTNYNVIAHEIVSNGETLFYINTYDNVFLQLMCDESLEGCHWDTLASQLEFPRESAFITLIPNHMADCN